MFLLFEPFHFLYHFSSLSMLHHLFPSSLYHLSNPYTLRAISSPVKSPVSSSPAPLSPTASHSPHFYYPSKQLDDRSNSNPHAHRSSGYTTYQEAHTRCIQNSGSAPSATCCWQVSTSDPRINKKLSDAAFLAPIAPTNIEIANWLERARVRLTALCGLPYPGDQHRTFHIAAEHLRRTLFGKGSLRWISMQSLRSPSWRWSLKMTFDKFGFGQDATDPLVSEWMLGWR